jgi:hypothetical protein
MDKYFSRFPGTGLYLEIAAKFILDDGMGRPEVILFGTPISVLATLSPENEQAYEDACFSGFSEGRFQNAIAPITEENQKHPIISTFGFSFLHCECGNHDAILHEAGWCTVPRHGIKISTWPFMDTDEEKQMFGSSSGFKCGDLLFLINAHGAFLEVCRNKQRVRSAFIRPVPFDPQLI